MSRLTLVFISLFCFSICLEAQTPLSKKITDGGNSKKRIGTYVTVGSTYMIGSHDNAQLTYSYTETTTYDLNYRAFGKMSPFLRCGAFVTPERGLFGIIEMGMGYNQYSGGQTLFAQRNNGADLSYPSTIEHKASFKHHMLDMHMNFKHIIPLTRTQFIIHGPGLAFDMLAKRKNEVEGNSSLPVDQNPEMKKFYSQVTYGAGFGMKLADGRFLLIEMRAPVFRILDSDTRSAEREIFNGNYRPILLGAITYSWLGSKADRMCVSTGGSSKGGRFSKNKSAVGRYPW